MQAKATPIREAVLLIKENHSVADLKNLGDQLQERFGIKTIQAYCHKDEGHYDKKTNEWKPNLHGHMVFDWTDHNTGKSIKLDQINRYNSRQALTLIGRGNIQRLTVFSYSATCDIDALLFEQIRQRTV